MNFRHWFVGLMALVALAGILGCGGAGKSPPRSLPSAPETSRSSPTVAPSESSEAASEPDEEPLATEIHAPVVTVGDSVPSDADPSRPGAVPPEDSSRQRAASATPPSALVSPEPSTTGRSREQQSGTATAPSMTAVAGRVGATTPTPSDHPDAAVTQSQAIEKKSGRGAAPPPPIDDKVAEVKEKLANPPAVAQVVLQPDIADAAPGSVLSFHIWIYGGQEVASVPFHLRFNPEVLQFQGGYEGPYLAADGAQTVFMYAGGSGGQSIVVGHSRLTRETGANGSGELCVLNFVAVAGGDPGLAFDRAKVIDRFGKDQPSTFQVQPLDIR